MSEIADQETERVDKALGRIPSGCSVLTSKSDLYRSGLLVSWLQQAGFEPPAISVALKKGRPIKKLIDESGMFVVNLLGENATAMLKHFSRGFELGDDAFAGLEIREVDEGIIIEDQIAWMCAEVRGKHDAGDHWVYLAEVKDAGVNTLQPPFVHIRKRGMQY